jgi:predicted RecA/RadA family phage recombinase
MANNFSQDGQVLGLTMPYDVTSGDGVQVGSIFGVATMTYAEGDTGQVATCGVWSLAKTSAQAWAEGQHVYWDDVNGRADSNPAVGILIGTATAAAENPSSTGYVKLIGYDSGSAAGVQQIRKRFTIAEVNAGATLLAARDGFKYRLVDAAAIAIGGAAGAVTTVDLLGTLTTSRKLVAFAQASLTQSTLLRAGASGAAILADGASFTANDENTALTVGKTGSDITTATHVDFLVSYAVEPA